MNIGRVIGSAVATAKDDRLIGKTLLVVTPSTAAGEPAGEPYVALDNVGAGVGELVLVTRGSAARAAFPEDPELPVDAAIVAIVDRIDVDGSPPFVKR